MRRQLATVTLLLALSAAAARLPWTPLDITGDECDGVTAGQRICADQCTKVLLCMGPSMDPIEVETCSADRLCVPQQGDCVDGTTECGADIDSINCHALGMFPDPTVCTAFHICTDIGQKSTYRKCDNGWAYDPVTTLCSKSLTDDVCTNLPIECKTLAETKPFPGNANIYYVCAYADQEELHPELYRCEHGETFDPDTLSCSNNS